MAACFKGLCYGDLTDITLLHRQRVPGRGQGNIEQPSVKTGTGVCPVNAMWKFHFIPLLILKFKGQIIE